MKPELEMQVLPRWLKGYEAFADNNKNLPLMDILKDSFFYPASGLDAWPIKYLSDNFYSFVYADYGVQEQKFLQDLHFKGYEIVLSREIDINNELHPDLAISFNAENIPDSIEVKNPYAYWVVAMKISDDMEGAEMFSLLFLAVEGIKVYNRLYVDNKIAPKALAIIQPGTGFGGNWTDFMDPDGLLANCVIKSDIPKPQYLVTGGMSGAVTNEPVWSIYKHKIAVVNPYLRCGFVVFEK
jgi:hypothetical protein